MWRSIEHKYRDPRTSQPVVDQLVVDYKHGEMAFIISRKYPLTQYSMRFGGSTLLLNWHDRLRMVDFQSYERLAFTSECETLAEYAVLRLPMIAREIHLPATGDVPALIEEDPRKSPGFGYFISRDPQMDGNLQYKLCRQFAHLFIAAVYGVGPDNTPAFIGDAEELCDMVTPLLRYS